MHVQHIGSGVCLTMTCSDICEIDNKTHTCGIPTCPEWNVAVRIFMYLTHYYLILFLEHI